MLRVAVVFAPGFEEIEAVTPVDVLRRAAIEVDMVGLLDDQVTGSHGISLQMDRVFDGDLTAYDMVVLPGGMPGSTNLRDHEGLVAALQERAGSGAFVAAICAAPLVLAQVGLLEGRRYTCFPGVEEQIEAGHHQTDVVVVDGQIVTGRGAGTSLAFAYTLVDLLGGDGQELADKMVYSQLFEK